MEFISNRRPQIEAMLKDLGIDSVDALFRSIPEELRCPRPTEEDGLSEHEGQRLMEALGAKNTFGMFDSYLGAGAYEHHIPVLCSAITSKSEFLTAYTPYQAETSQGMLQAIFEYQSALAALTGLDVTNASLYDGASAAAESALMGLRAQRKRRTVLLDPDLHPAYHAVIHQYVDRQGVNLKTIENLESDLNDDVAIVLIQSPSFFGSIQDVKAISKLTHDHGALLSLVANPLSFGLFASAKELGADIACGDTQPFGLPLQFGGPFSGYITCTNKLVRQLPGRLVSETTDTKGRRGFTLTLQAREQHIRREKATSNICSNQALAALSSLVAILWYGPKGIKELALTCYQRAHYLHDQLTQIPGVNSEVKGPFFHEFVISFDKPIAPIMEALRAKKIEPGLALCRFFPNKENQLLIAVTETKTENQLNAYIKACQEALA